MYNDSGVHIQNIQKTALDMYVSEIIFVYEVFLYNAYM
jgi:hypothetical protein